jgi:hypothetical protein
MLPSGHIAAGYLVTRGFLAWTHPALSVLEQDHLIWWGMFFSFAPDLDTFAVFAKAKRFISTGNINHRKFFSHAPILWMLLGLLISFGGWLGHSLFWEYAGIVAWLGSWSHFVLDTIQSGVMWLWPFRKHQIALKDAGLSGDLPADDFIPYWINFMKFYATEGTLSFSLEIVTILVALVVFFR